VRAASKTEYELLLLLKNYYCDYEIRTAFPCY
jgi:hypothetical protein